MSRGHLFYMNIGERLKLIREKININQANLAKDLGISARMLREYEKDKFCLDACKIQILINKYNVNPTYLFLGIGEIFLNEEISKDYVKSFKNKYKISDFELEIIIQELLSSSEIRLGLLKLIETKKKNKNFTKDIGDIIGLLLS